MEGEDWKRIQNIRREDIRFGGGGWVEESETEMEERKKTITGSIIITLVNCVLHHW